MRKHKKALNGTGVTVKRNTIQNGIEVKFAAKPTEKDIIFLKQKGFRWSGRQGLWYVKYNENLLTKVQEYFENVSSEPDQEKPVERKPNIVLTLEEKAIERQNAYEKAKGYWKVDNLMKLAVDGYESFIANPPKNILFDSFVLEYDTKRREYWHLPAKRKRPDWYSLIHSFDMILRAVLKQGGNPGLLKHVKYLIKYQNTLYDKSSFEYFINNYPQYSLDPDYNNLIRYYDDLDKYQVADNKRWEEWYKKNIKEGEKIWVHSNSNWEQRTIRSFGRNFGRYIGPTIEVERNHGYIIEVGTYRITSLFNAPGGKNLAELYPDVESNPYGIPNLDSYLVNNNIDLLSMEFEALEIELQLITI